MTLFIDPSNKKVAYWLLPNGWLSYQVEKKTGSEEFLRDWAEENGITIVARPDFHHPYRARHFLSAD